jgi:hypothetical protein
VVGVKFNLSGPVTCMGEIRVRQWAPFMFLFGMKIVERVFMDYSILNKFPMSL